MLLDAHLLTGKLGAINISLFGQATYTAQQLGQGFARERVIHAGRGHFALNTNQAAALGLGHTNVRLAENVHHIARLQHQVLRQIAIEHQGPQVKGDELV